MNAMKKVLVVDDDPVVGRSFDRVLSGKGYAVITASSGGEALARMRDEDYDVVYTDIKMPGMSGIEVARRIKASRPWMPVVIVTGYGNEANEAEAKAIGVAGFLHKPLSPETIEGSAREAVATAPAPAAPAEAAVPALERRSAWRDVGLFAKNIGLFFAAPFVALFYVVVGPFVAIGLLAWVALKALKGERAK